MGGGHTKRFDIIFKKNMTVCCLMKKFPICFIYYCNNLCLRCKVNLIKEI